MVLKESITDFQNLKQQAVFGRITSEFNSATSVEQVLDTVVLSVQDLGYTYCSLWEQQGPRLVWKTPGLGIPEWLVSSVKRIAASLGMEQELSISVPLDSESVYSQCFVEQEPVSARNPDDLLRHLYLGDTPFQDLPKLVLQSGVKLVERLDAPEHTAFPIANYGVIFMASPGETHAAEHKEWVRIILKQAETAIERQLAVEALRESEERFAKAFRSSPNLMAITRMADGRMVNVNDSFARVVGYDRDELLGRSTVELGLWADLDDRKRITRSIKHNGRVENIEVQIGTKSGEIRIVLFSAELINLNGEAHLITVASDITERNRMEQRLQAREETLQALLNAPTESAMLIDLDGVILATNEITAERVGKKADELVGLSIDDFLPPDLAESRRAQGEEVARTGKPIRFLDERAGRHFDNNIYPVLDAEGRVTGIAVYSRDITEAKLAEDALQQSEQRLRDIAHNLPGMIFQFRVSDDGSSHFSYASPRATDLFGLPSDLDQPDWELGLRVHPDDRDEFFESIAQATADRSDWDFEGRLVMPAGEVKWIRGISSPTQVGGELIFNGLVLDVTKQKHAEQALRKSEARYRALFERANDAVFLTNLSDEIIDVNQRTCDLLGYSREELLGMQVHDLQAPETRGLVGSVIKGELERFGEKPFEAVDVHRSGRRIPVEISASLIGDQETGLVFTIVRDITERKRVEEERRERERFLAVLNDITRAALNTPDLSTMAQILADRLGELISADGCYITRWDEVAQRTCPLAAYGTVRNDYASVEVQPDEPTLTEAVMQAGRALVIEDVYDTPYLSQRLVERFPDRSLLALPLIAGGQFKGAALIAFNQLHRFTPDEIARGELIAEHIALAMTKVWLLEQERTVRERAEALYHVARTMIDLKDLSTRLQTVVDSVAEVLPADRVTLIVLDMEARETLQFVTGGPGASQVMAVPFEELREGLTGWVMQERKPALSPKGVADSRETPLVQQRRSETNCGDIIVVPLAYQDELLGTMTAIRRPDQPDLGQQDVDLMMAMAYQAAIGIENTRLVEGLEAKVQARTADIHAEKEKSEAILRSAGDAITMSDLQMHIQYVNDAFTTLTGYSKEEVLGHHAGFLSSNETPDRMHGSMRTVVEEGQVWRTEVTAQRKDGRRYDALLTIAPMHDVEGNLVGFVSSHRNISQQKELDRARNRFLTNVSHELRTPLTNISLYAQLAQKAQDSPDKTERYLKILKEQTERLKTLIQGVLQMTELDAGQAVQSWKPVQLASVLQDAVIAHQDPAGAADLTLIVNPMPAQLPTVMGDQMRLTQALAELIDNALAFTPAGGRVTVNAKTAKEDGQDWVIITVSDTGPGIAPEEQELIFDRLYRGRQTDAGNIRGLGLGLSMAQEILRAHGGRITVESELGQGSIFAIWLRCWDGG